MNRSTPESVVLEFVECINDGDLEGIAARIAEVYKFTDMEGEVYVIEGVEGVRARWDEYLSAYPDYRIIVRHVLRGGDSVAIVGQTTGSHLSAEVERDETVLWIGELDGGLISEWRIYSTLMCEKE